MRVSEKEMFRHKANRARQLNDHDNVWIYVQLYSEETIQFLEYTG